MEALIWRLKLKITPIYFLISEKDAEKDLIEDKATTENKAKAKHTKGNQW
ncbi:MAG: hypothetical protein HN576_16250 [Bacteriovoracaceae bacterium]|jgi:hypothetical protein|nr:hypothetical protein [Bacteriovoracaceae bacterium]